MNDAEAPRPEPQQLNGPQRAFLRGLAHRLEPVVQVGQAGVTRQVTAAVDEALLSHELIKVRLLRPADKKGMAHALAAGSGAHLCGLVGHTVILYRRHPERPRIHLPGERARSTGEPRRGIRGSGAGLLPVNR